MGSNFLMRNYSSGLNIRQSSMNVSEEVQLLEQRLISVEIN